MPQVVWLPEALADLVRHFDFLRLKNKEAAAQAAQAIREAGFSLAEMPGKGAALQDGSGRRKLIVPFGRYGYVMLYVLESDRIVILRIYHGRENRPY
jgi:plasmid stabilization system protein ParE